MGGEVAQVVASAGIPVLLKDVKTLKFLYVAGTPSTDISVLQPLKDKGLKVFDQ